jgi:hypothetical protein
VALEIESLSPAGVAARRAALIDLLRDAVESGASIGFLPPMSEAEAGAYWEMVATATGEGSRVLLAAQDAELGLVGSAQLDLAMRENARHRAEVSKVALEGQARRLGRTTLILDTRQGDPSEALYEGLGWTFAGAIPAYARSATGALDATAYYYKLLDPGP